MSRPLWLLGGVLLVLGTLWWRTESAPLRTDTGAGTQADSRMPIGASEPGQMLERAVGWLDGTTRRTALQWEHWLFAKSSLRGASLDGGWGEVGIQGVMPSRALRRRFDQLMTTQGELNPTEMRAMVQALAERDLGDAASSVMAVWDAYVALLQAPLSARVDMNSPQQWLGLLREQQALRQQLLGPQWAQAFFAEEDAYLLATVEKVRDSGTGSAALKPALWAPPPADVSAEQWHSLRRQTLGPHAADRLAALEQQEAQWSERLGMARQTLQDLRGLANLSAVQREAALQQWLDAHFAAQEQVRVRALLGV